MGFSTDPVARWFYPEPADYFRWFPKFVKAFAGQAIADGTAFQTEEARHTAYAILAAQEFDDMIPAGLPPDTVVLHKTGEITRIRHDAAIIYPQGKHPVPYVLVVLTRGFDDPKEATSVIVDVSRAVYAEHTGKVEG